MIYSRSVRFFTLFGFLLVLVPAAFGQSVTCSTALPNQPLLRQEGLAEPIADILINCVGTEAGVQNLNLTVSGAAIASRPLFSGIAPPSVPTEAALLINDCTTNSGISPTGANCGPNGTFLGGNPAQGFLIGGQLSFGGFTFPTTGAFQLRITNLRINAHQLPPGSFVLASLAGSFNVLNSTNLLVGTVQSSLSFAVATPVSTFQGCGSQSVTVQNLTFGELTSTAFRSPATALANATPGAWYQFGTNNESQTVLNSPAGWSNTSNAIPGQADYATRIRVSLSGIPSGVTVSLPTNLPRLIANATGDFGAFSPAPGNSISIAGSGSVTYEVRVNDPGSRESYNVPITISTNGNPGSGTILVSASYAPNTTAVLPLFANTSTPTALFNISGCTQTATGLRFAAPPSSVAAGVALPVGVNVIDVLGSIVPSSVPVTLISSPGAINTTVNSSNGLAAFSNIVFGTPGVYTLTASSPGLASSTSAAFTVQTPTTLALSSGSNPAQFGQPVALTAVISPSSATGRVTFYDGAMVLGDAAISNGQAQLTTSTLTTGSRSLKARYSGSVNYAGILSPALVQMVIPLPANQYTFPALYATGGTPGAILAGDFNGDGFPDVAVADRQGTTVSIFLGSRTGIMTLSANYSVGSQPWSIVSGDFNMDGKPDLAVSANQDGIVAILLGDGTGKFHAGQTLSSFANPRNLAVADFNNDGIPDLAVGASSNTGTTVLLGKGDGTFIAMPAVVTGSFPTGLVSADFNGDGNADLAIANFLESKVSVALGKGDGTFQTAVSYPTAALPLELVATDFNADGVPDLAVAMQNVTNQTQNIVTLLGNGDGTFRNHASGIIVNSAAGIAAADFTGDGKVDLAIGQSFNSFGLLAGLGDGGFNFSSAYTAGFTPVAIAVADFDGDGRPDLATANFAGGNFSIIFGGLLDIEGRVTLAGAGLSGVTLSLTGDRTGSAVTDATGHYNLTAVHPGESYTVTPSLNGYQFTPASASFATLAATQTANFTATPVLVTISGQVTASGVGQSGVTINVTGSQTLSTTTDAFGNYSVSVQKIGTYTVAASLAGFIFSGPVNVSNLTGNQTVNFTGSAILTISGQVNASTGPLSGVTISINGTQATSATTNVTGGYSVQVPKNGTYILSAARSGYSFSGPVTLSNLLSNQTVNFTGISTAGLQFIPVTPCRVADTRALGGKSGAFGPPSLIAGQQRTFPIPLGNCGIPSNAAAYSLNFTVIPHGYLGFLTTWPTGQAEPLVSTLNSYLGAVVANAAIVPAGTNGSIDVHVTDATDVLFDINGYFAAPPASGFYYFAVSPCRVADTRAAGGKSGAFGPPTLGTNGVRSFPIPTSTCLIPAAAKAYSLNFTVIPQGYLGFLSTWPTGQAEPGVSTLNSYSGALVANAAIVPAGTSGAISVHVTDPADVLFDINGYFGPQAANGLQFYPVTPCRVADTRSAAGKTGAFGPPSMTAGQQRAFPIPSSSCGIPPTAQAYSLNITVIPQGYLGFLTTWPTGQTEPVVSTLNSYNGQVVANAAIVPAGAAGAISIHVTDPADVLFDINGYFAP